MATNAVELTIDRYEVSDVPRLKKILLDIYEEVYADQLADPFFSTPRYWERIEGYGSRDGFTLVTGSLSEMVIGYALGYTLPHNSGWWSGLNEEVDPEEVSETGSRTFALTEIMVRAKWRRRGYARKLHDALLLNRTKSRATLLVLPENIPAYFSSWPVVLST